MTLSQSRRFARVAAASACLALAVAAGVQSPASAKTRTFSCGDLPVSKTPAGLKGGYITQIAVTGSYTKKSSACKSGTALALAYYKCRHAKGIKANCSGKTINGLKCSESRPADSQSDDQINARVTCKKGSKKIVHLYQQNL
jgi:negative regulator of sigma E activity